MYIYVYIYIYIYICVYRHIKISKSRENERKKENGKIWVVFTKETNDIETIHTSQALQILFGKNCDFD